MPCSRHVCCFGRLKCQAIPALLIVLTVIGCREEVLRAQETDVSDCNVQEFHPAEKASLPPPAISDAWYYRARDVEKQAIAYLADMPICEEQVADERCREIDIFSPLNDDNISGSEPVVMIIESDLEHQCALAPNGSIYGRYRRRVVGRYETTSDGSYVACQAKAKINRALAGINDKVLGAYPFTPARLLNSEVLSDVYERFPKFGGYNDHADIVTSIAAEYAHEAHLVLASLPVPSIAFLCTRDLNALENSFKTALRTLKTVIKLHGVRFINMSSGISRSDARELFDVCDGVAPSDKEVDGVLRVLQNFVRGLSSIDGVVLVQAGPTVLQELSPQDLLREFPIDCDTDSYPNRIRVGGFSLPSMRLPEHGADFSTYRNHLYPALQNSESCVDVAINGAFLKRGMTKNGPGLEFAEFLGTVSTPAIPVSSYVAPVALAALLKKAQDMWPEALHQINPQALLRAYTSNGQYKLQDPLAHDLNISSAVNLEVH